MGCVRTSNVDSFSNDTVLMYPSALAEGNVGVRWPAWPTASSEAFDSRS